MRITGTASVTEIDREVYFATAHKQKFLLNDSYSLIGKTCSDCGNFYTVDSFYKDSANLFSKTTTCKHCRADRMKQFRADNPTYFSDYWLREREQMTATYKDWLDRHPDKRAEYMARQYSARQKALANCYPDDKQYIAEIDGNKVCAVTGVAYRVSVDHVLPVTKGRWGNNRGNLVMLYDSLNISKNNQNVFLWAESMEQVRLDYLLPDGIPMSVQEFQQRMKQLIAVKAEELGLSYEQYKQEYTEEYNRKQEEQ